MGGPGSGGARPGSGRIPGQRDALPRAGSKKYSQLKSLGEFYDTSEFYVTNYEKIFNGNALALMKALYKAEQLPVRVRLYAASKAAEVERFEGVGTVEGSADVEAETEKIWEMMAEFVRLGIREAINRKDGLAAGEAPAWIQEIVIEELAQDSSTPASEILPRGPPPVTFRKITPPPEIDGAAAQHDCNMDVEVIEKSGVSTGRTD